MQSLNITKLRNYLPRFKNLLDKKILLNDNVNGKIVLNIDCLSGIKFFNKAIINLSILNGKLFFNDSIFISEKIGSMVFEKSLLEIVDDEKIIKLAIFLDVLN